MRPVGREDALQRPVLRTLAVALLTACLPLAAYLATRAPSISWANGGADGGDLATAVLVRGAPHPPGYPTYTIVGILWSALPVGADVAARLVLLSVLSGALACAVLGATASWLAGQSGASRRCATAAGIVVGIGWGLSPTIWSQAVIVEVYAHGMVWLGVATLLLLRAHVSAGWRAFFAAGTALGLGFGALPQIVVLVPSALALVRGWLGRPGRVASAVAAVGGSLLGLAIFAYLPLRATAAPSAIWGDPTTPAGLVAVVTAAVYRDIPASLDTADRLRRSGESLAIVVEEIGILAPFVLVGVGALVRTQRGPAGLLLALLLLTIAFRASYPAEGNIVYLLPATYVACILAGIGLAHATQFACARYRRWSVLVPLIVGVVVLVRAPTMLAAVDASQDRRADRFSNLVMATLPDGAIVVSEHDETTFVLWYRQALGDRPDLIVLDGRLLTHDWYRTRLARQHPELDARALRPGGLTALGRPLYVVRFDPTTPGLPALEPAAQ